MLTRVLAQDLRTPPEVLAALAARPGHTPPAALAVAVAPQLTAGAHLAHPAPHTATDLAAALTHPALPAAHRGTLIAATATAGVLDLITHTDLLTPAEIEHFHSAQTLHGPNLDLSYALAANPATPPHLARTAVGDLRTQAHTSPQANMLYTAAALRHHLPAGDPLPGTSPAPRTLAELTGQLLTHVRAQPETERPTWWAASIAATADPDLARAALQDTYSPQAAKALLEARRLPLALRTAAALWATAAGDRHLTVPISELAATATAAVTELLALSPDPYLAFAIAHNPTTTPTTLAHLWNTWRPGSLSAARIRDALAAHPNAPADLRTEADTLPPRPLTRVAALLRGGQNAGQGLLEARVTDLHDSDVQRCANYGERLRGAYASYTRPLTTPGQVAAAFGLDVPTFPGTLRELLDTAHTVTA